MVNSWKDQIPVLVAVASVEQDALGRDLFQETDHCEVMPARGSPARHGRPSGADPSSSVPQAGSI